MTSTQNLDIDQLKSRIDEQANLVRQLKSDPKHKVRDDQN